MDDYVYLGVTFNYNNKFTKAINRRLTLARKACFDLLLRCQNLQLPIDIQIDLFHKIVLPVLLYGSEIWGYSQLDQIELFYRKFLKQILKVSKFTGNCIIYGETGCFELKNQIYGRIINYWNKLKTGDAKKISVTIH